jgi:uncharacterized protein DUF1707
MKGMSSAEEMRIGNDERDAAQAALQQHLSAGRIDLAEFDERSLRAAQAHTRAELAALFADLPAPHPVLPAASSWQQIRRRSTGPLGGPLFGRTGETAARLAPLVALALFFLVWHSWLVFLLVPISAAVIYGNRRGRASLTRPVGPRGRCGRA